MRPVGTPYRVLLIIGALVILGAIVLDRSETVRELAWHAVLQTPLRDNLGRALAKARYEETLTYQLRQDACAPAGAVVFFGSSQIHGLCVEAIACPALNYGIGSDTTEGLLARLPEYHSLARAKAIVINIGGNDAHGLSLRQTAANFRELLAGLPAGKPVLVCGVLPVDERISATAWTSNRRIGEVNRLLADECNRRAGCLFRDMTHAFADESGMLASAMHIGDGLHLNRAGRELFQRIIREALLREAIISQGEGPR